MKFAVIIFLVLLAYGESAKISRGKKSYDEISYDEKPYDKKEADVRDKGTYVYFGRPFTGEKVYSYNKITKESVYKTEPTYGEEKKETYYKSEPTYEEGKKENYYKSETTYEEKKKEESYETKPYPTYNENKKEESYETKSYSTYDDKKEKDSYETTTEYYTTEYPKDYVGPTVYNVNEPGKGEDRDPAIVIKVYPIYPTTEKYYAPEPVYTTEYTPEYTPEYTTEYVEPETTPYYEEEKKEESYETTTEYYEEPTTEYYKEETKNYSPEPAYGPGGVVYGAPLYLQPGGYSDKNGYAGAGPVFFIMPAMYGQQAHAMVPMYAPSYSPKVADKY